MMESISLESTHTAATAAAMVTPVSTTLSDEALLDRVITEVFGKAKFIKVKTILETNEVANLVELAMYDYHELAEMQGSVQSTSTPGDFVTVALSKTEAKKLSLLKQWYKSQPNASWHKFTKDQLDTFIMGSEPMTHGTPATDSPSKLNYTPYTPYTPMSVSTQTSLVADFHKSIKRSTSDYPRLKDDTLFGTWDSTVQAIAMAQDVAEVLDCSYSPSNEV